MDQMPHVVTASKVRPPSLQTLIDKAQPGDEVIFPDGYYHESITIDRSNIDIKGYGKVVIGGWAPMPMPSRDKVAHGKLFRVGKMPHFDMDVSKNSQVIDSHNQAMNPWHIMHQPSKLPKSAGRVVLKQCFDLANYRANAAAGVPCFYVNGHYRGPEYVLCHVPSGDYRNLYYADLPRLVTFSDGSRFVGMENIEIHGAANTKKEGALWIRGEGHMLDAVQSLFSNTIGIVVHGSNHHFMRTRGDYNGQMGWFGAPAECTFTECYNSYNNLWNLFDPSWEAGHKFVNSKGNKVRGWRGDYNGGPGFWLDLSNKNWDLYDIGLLGNTRAAMQIEHYAENISAEKVRIRGVERGGRNNTSVGLQLQSNIKHCSFTDFEIEGCAEAIRYKKVENRGPSGLNSFTQVRSKSPFVIEGKNEMPDVMKDVPRLIKR